MKIIFNVGWNEIKKRLKSTGIDRFGEKVYGVPKGGLCVAALLEHAEVVTDPGHATVILDDIQDSGRTRDHYVKNYPHTRFVVLFNSQDYDIAGQWVVFPWEHAEQNGPTDAVVRLLQFMGEDPNREGLKDTPERVLRAWKELTRGYNLCPKEALKSAFTSDSDEMVVLRGTRFTSTCEHHLLPFMGSAEIAYIPSGKVVGISKLCRLVEVFACRLQIQEQMTHQIAHALMDSHLKPKGVGVIIRAHHQCMSCRGVRQSETELVTSALLGVIREDQSARSEFLRLSGF
jgi:GTP cyclohydrolase I